MVESDDDFECLTRPTWYGEQHTIRPINEYYNIGIE